MADNVAITAGSGTTIAADELSINSTSVKVQRNKLVAGADGTYVGDVSGRLIDGDSNASALYVDNRPKVTRIQVTPTVSNGTAYAVKDAVGGLLTFANAARASGGSILIQSAQLTDKDQRLMAMDLVLYRASITAPTDNAVFNPSDAENLDYLGHLTFSAGEYADFSSNSAACKNVVGLEATLSGTSLYGVLVCRSVVTAYSSTSSVSVTLTIIQD